MACGLYIRERPAVDLVGNASAGHFLLGPVAFFLIEGLLFLLTGFQMRLLFEWKRFRLRISCCTTALVAIMSSSRVLPGFDPATYLPRLISKSIRTRRSCSELADRFRDLLHGVRGAVSLAAALALPLALPNGEAFPHRDMILFVAFGVIFITLVGSVRDCRWSHDGSTSPKTAATSIEPRHNAEIAARAMRSMRRSIAR